MRDLDAQYEVLGRLLEHGPSQNALTRREVELLHLMALASAAFTDPDEIVDVLRNVDSWRSELKIPASYASVEPGDETALQVLLHLGLLARRSSSAAGEALEQVAVLSEGDPVYRLLRGMECS
jgi:hypothetical protein